MADGMVWRWYRCYVRWRHGARRLPRRVLIVLICVPLSLLVLYRLGATPSSASLGQRKYGRARVLRELPAEILAMNSNQQNRQHGGKQAEPIAAPRGEKPKLSAPLPDIPAGVRPEVAALYQRSEFTCLRSGEVMPLSRVNDDYCDCADGTDEPGTAACANGVFFCGGRVIPSSRVGDGVCDCCDGADEAGSPTPAFQLPAEIQRRLGRYQPPCPNVCR